MDPVDKAWESGYAVMGNNPIWNIDSYGDDFVNVHTERKEKANIYNWDLGRSLSRTGCAYVGRQLRSDRAIKNIHAITEIIRGHGTGECV